MGEEVFTREQVKEVNREKLHYLIIEDGVYDVTAFTANHPGGSIISKYFGMNDDCDNF